MIKRFRMRAVSLLLVLIMLISMVPITVVQAAGDTFSVKDVTLERLVGDDNTGVTGSDSFRVSATGEFKENLSYASSTGSVTISVAASTKNRVLSFSYYANFSSPADKAGTITIGGNAVTSSAAYSCYIPAGPAYSLVVSVESAAGPNTTSVDIENVLLTESVDNAKFYIVGAKVGDFYTAGGYVNSDLAQYGEPTTLHDTYENVTLGRTVIAMEAVPEKGAEFLAYIDSETQVVLSNDARFNFIPTYDGQSVCALFVPESVKADDESAVYRVGSYYTKGLENAIAYAMYARDRVIVVNQSKVTLPAGKYTIPRSVTLLVPFDAAGTLYQTVPENTYDQAATVTENYYSLFTLEEGVKIIVDKGGAISVSAKHPATSHEHKENNGAVTGMYGQIDMEKGSNITLNDGAALYAWGFITGGGEIEATQGSAVYEFFQINDYRGGGAILSMTSEANSANNQFFFNQYYVQNIEATLTVYYGATEYVLMDLVFEKTKTISVLKAFVGDRGAFQLDSEGAKISKTYDPDKDVMDYDFYGVASLHTISIEAVGVQVSTDNYYLPINDINVTVHEGAEMNMEKKVLFLPGSGVTVEKDASICISGTGSVVFADPDDETIQHYSFNPPAGDGSSSIGAPFSPVAFSPSRKSTSPRTWESTETAFLENNGTVTVTDEGTLSSTSGDSDFGGDGTYIIDSTAEPPVLMYFSGGSLTEAEEATDLVVLQNDDDTDPVDTTVRWCDPASFTKKKGVWGDYRYVAVYAENQTTLLKESDEEKTRDQLDDFVADIPEQTKEDELYFYDFTGWEVYDYEAASNTVKLCPTFASRSKLMTVHWYDVNGDWVCNTEVLYGNYPDGNDIPVQERYPGAALSRESTTEKQYELAWYDADPASHYEILPVITGETSFYATFIECDRVYTITWKNYRGNNIGSQTSEVTYGATPSHASINNVKPNGSVDPVFYGWYDPDTKLTYAKDALPPVTRDTTYYTVYSVDSVWYDSDGTTVLHSGKTPNTAPRPDDEHMTLPDKEGQKFIGWTKNNGGDVYDSNSIPAVTTAITAALTYTAVYENTVEGKSLTLNGLIGENIQFGDGVTVNSASLSYTVNETGKTVKVEYDPADPEKQDTIDADNKMSISMAPAEMTYDITASYTVDDGTRTFKTSGAAYADSIFSKKPTEEDVIIGDFYVVGTIEGENCWPDDDGLLTQSRYHMSVNSYKDDGVTPKEYIVRHVYLKVNDKIKVLQYNGDKSTNGWYPNGSGNDYVINDSTGGEGYYWIMVTTEKKEWDSYWSDGHLHVEKETVANSVAYAWKVTSALMNYATKAQQYFGRNTDNLANTHVAGNTYTYTDAETDDLIAAYDTAHPNTMSALKTGDAADALAADYGLVYYGSNLVLNAGVTIRHYFRVVDESKVPDSVKFVRNNAEYTAFKTVVSPGFISYDYAGNGSGIPGPELGDVVTISFSGGEKATLTGDYNVFNYLKLAIADATANPSEKKSQLAAMMRAMYWYYIEADAYFSLS